MNSFQQELADRKAQHLHRRLRLPSPDGIDFYSNDYLGFARSSSLKERIDAAYKNLSDSKNGSTGSRLLSGNSSLAEQVEKEIANYHDAEDALLYGSGYAANLGLLSCLGKRSVAMFMDELLHASLIDGARLGYATRVKFRHNDLNDLEQKLDHSLGDRLVIVEGVYSMDGDIAHLKELLNLCQHYRAGLIVDEAHSVGIYGENGEGISQALGVHKELFARIITYGKAPGIHGAAVVGPTWLKDYQLNFSRSQIFSTAPPDHQLVSISCMYQEMKEASESRKQLKKIITYFVEKRKASPGIWVESDSQIQSLIITGNQEVMSAGAILEEKGINALPIRKPSVPEGLERIRFCLHSYNTTEEVDLLFDVLDQWMKEG